MICPVEIAHEMSALRAARMREHVKHGLLPEGRDGAGNESTGRDVTGDGQEDYLVAGSRDIGHQRPAYAAVAGALRGRGVQRVVRPATGQAVASSGAGGDGGEGVRAGANWNCGGTSSSVVDVDNGSRKIALYAVQAPQNWFEDFGSGQLSHGSTVVHLEAVFAQTVNSELEYHVFLTPNGDCRGLYVSRKSPTSFEVHELDGGTSNVGFDYRIVALRKGYESVRLADRTRVVGKFMQMAQKVHDANLHAPAKIEPPVVPPQPLAPKPPNEKAPVLPR